MRGKSLIFDRPYKVEVQEEEVDGPGENQLLVKTEFSAISAGTELLVYRGEFPEDMVIDSAITGYGNNFEYPLQYGYSAVGQVIELGEGVSRKWLGRKVFSFKPHRSYFLAGPDELYPLPGAVKEKDAVFLPGMETAVNIVQDAAPILGEKAAVLGQGTVGLLTAHLLACFPLDALIGMDRYPLRRKASIEAGCQDCLDPGSDDFSQRPDRLFPEAFLPGKADLVIELSGNPEALNCALDWVGFSGRIIIGSWYGKKQASVNLGAEFHRRRIKLISSQVSTIAPELSGRWNKRKRMDLSWSELERVGPGKLISHEFAIDEADQAFELLDKFPEQVLQVIFRYD